MCNQANHSVVEVPACFNDKQRQSTKNAGTIAASTLREVVIRFVVRLLYVRILPTLVEANDCVEEIFVEVACMPMRSLMLRVLPGLGAQYL